jgi:DNA-binding NarL/FixJ family response regulator
MGEPRLRILCVDDHAFVIEGFRARVAREPDLEVVGQLSSADDLVETARRTRADIVLLDVEMPGVDPFAAVADLREQMPSARVIMLSAFVRDSYIDEAYRVGAWGYLSKRSSPDAVIQNIRNVARGEWAYSPEVRVRLSTAVPKARREASSRLSDLSGREQQILRLIARGLTRTEIAKQLSRSPMTVDNHRKSIMKKLGLRDRTDLVRYAIAEGLVEV